MQITLYFDLLIEALGIAFLLMQAIWMLVPSEGYKEFKCSYNRNGRFALLCGIGAAVILASAMLLLHAYMWLAFKNESPLSLLFGDHSIAASRQATALFLTTWCELLPIPSKPISIQFSQHETKTR